MTDPTSDLTERYVWAVTHRLPAAQRDDVGAELRATIADMSEDRMATTAPSGAAVAAPEMVIGDVLLELGDPALLASRYRGGTRQLIGPGLYDDFRRTITTLLAIIIPVTLIVIITINIAIEQKPITAGIGEGALFTGQAAVQVAFWTIVAYALIERARSRAADAGQGPGWKLTQLPKLPSGRPIRLSGVTVSIIFSALALAWLIAQNFLSGFTTRNGDPIPVLDPALWSGWLPMLMVLLIAGIAIDVASLRIGRWTLAVMLINVVFDVVAVGFLLIMITTQQVLDPRYVVAFGKASPDLDPADAGHFVLLVVLLVAVLGTIRAIRGYRNA
ncbi:MAG TPA: hypothetical protein VIP98_24985 [Microlunatus sp.]